MSASILSQHTGVSVQFVEQILKPLKQHGLTKSVRGAAGGHQLARPAEDITLGEVVRLMEGGICLTVCCGDKASDCPRQDACLTRRAWMKVSKSLEAELNAITLATLLHDDPVCPSNQISVLGKPMQELQPVAKKDNGKYQTRLTKVITRKASAAKRGHYANGKKAAAQ
jgi:Rrf2 family protein